MSSPSISSSGGFMYLALFDCAADEEEELEFIAGDLILVLRKEDDMWWYGINQRTNKEGMLPYNYVEKCDLDAPSPFDSPNTQRRLAALARTGTPAPAPLPPPASAPVPLPLPASSSLAPPQPKSISTSPLPPALSSLPLPPLNSLDPTIAPQNSTSSIPSPLPVMTDDERKTISLILSNTKQKVPLKFSSDLLVAAAAASPRPPLPQRGYPRKHRASSASPSSSTRSDSSPAVTPEHGSADSSISLLSIPQPHSASAKQFVVAIRDYASGQPNTLTFKKGDTIEFVKTVNERWNYGSIGGESGMYPINYVQPAPAAALSCSPPAEAIEHIRIAREGCESLVLWIVANPTDPKVLNQIGETSNAVTSASQKVIDLLSGVPSGETQPLVNSVKIFSSEIRTYLDAAKAGGNTDRFKTVALDEIASISVTLQNLQKKYYKL